MSAADQTAISLEELAEPFSRHIVDHLARAPKQATSVSSRFLDACRTLTDQDELITATVKLGFNNVIDGSMWSTVAIRRIRNAITICVNEFILNRATGGSASRDRAR
jgi:hypothetical protein